MSSGPLLQRLGRAAARHQFLVIGTWVLIVGAIFVWGRAAGSAFVDDFRIPGSQAQQAIDVLNERFPERAGATATIAFHARQGTLADPATLGIVRGTLGDVARLPHVLSVADPTEPGGEGGVSADRTIAFTTVRYDEDLSMLGRPAADRLIETVAPLRSSSLQVEVGGPLISYTHLPEPRGSEIVGIVAAVVVLFLAFGSVMAMAMPIVTALFGLAGSLAIVWLLSHLGDVPTLTPTLAAMLGLGVGIDYALFIVTRYREELGRGSQPVEAVGLATGTAGKAVLFAGGTVIVAIWGLWVSGMPLIGLIGSVSSIAVAIAVLAALTLLPALLGLVGNRIDRLRIPRLHRRSGSEGVWGRWARAVALHPWISLGAGLVVIGLLMVPVFSMELGLEVGVSGRNTTQERAAALVARGFGPGVNGPLAVVLELPASGSAAPAVAQTTRAVAADPDVLAVTEPAVSVDGRTAVFSAIPRSAPGSDATGELVRRLRDRTMPPIERGTGATVLVSGATALFVDLKDLAVGRLPLLIAVVIALSFVLLLVMFRSILVPVKAAILNVLSICAAYGAVVAVFQWGLGARLLGLEGTVEVISFVPMVMFAILFGLSMDYEVFLLSRIREEYLVDRDTIESVVTGIRSTARVITSAAMVMIVVFLAFVLNESTVVKMIGFGLAVAVLVDATVVRIVLVPATMVLLGHANWWLPRWLDRLLPGATVPGPATPSPPPAVPGAAPFPAPAAPRSSPRRREAAPPHDR